MRKFSFFTVIAFLFTLGCTKSNVTRDDTVVAQEIKATRVTASNLDYYHSILQNNVQEQFSTNIFSISDVQVQKSNSAEIVYITYKTDIGVESHAAVVAVGNETIKVDGQTLQNNKTYLVDCYGSCACIEEYHVGTGGSGGYFACSCSSCRMRLTEL